MTNIDKRTLQCKLDSISYELWKLNKDLDLINQTDLAQIVWSCSNIIDGVTNLVKSIKTED